MLSSLVARSRATESLLSVTIQCLDKGEEVPWPDVLFIITRTSPAWPCLAKSPFLQSEVTVLAPIATCQLTLWKSSLHMFHPGQLRFPPTVAQGLRTSGLLASCSASVLAPPLALSAPAAVLRYGLACGAQLCAHAAWLGSRSLSPSSLCLLVTGGR